MIKVVFKLNKQNDYDTTPFTYADYSGIEINDIVVVETRYGYAIAKVVEVNVNDNRFNEENLANVKIIIESAAEQREKQDRIRRQKDLITRIHRGKILDMLSKMSFEEEDTNIINTMTDNELDQFYNELIKKV